MRDTVKSDKRGLTLCMMEFSWQKATPFSSISMYPLTWDAVRGRWEFLMTSERSDNMYSNTSTKPVPWGKTSLSFTTYRNHMLFRTIGCPSVILSKNQLSCLHSSLVNMNNCSKHKQKWGMMQFLSEHILQMWSMFKGTNDILTYWLSSISCRALISLRAWLGIPSSSLRKATFFKATVSPV